MPHPVIFERRRLPASYANFYISNGAVLVPVFNDPNDRVALNTLAELFPVSEIVPIYSGDLIWGLGAPALHDAAATEQVIVKDRGAEHAMSPIFAAGKGRVRSVI